MRRISRLAALLVRKPWVKGITAGALNVHHGDSAAERVFVTRKGSSMRRATVVGLTLIVALLGCIPKTPAADEADPNGTITTVGGISGEDPAMDPARANAAGFTDVLQVFEPPLRFDPLTLGPVQGAAKALPDISSDGLTYQLTIRDDSKFSDGTPVRAQDFVYGFSRACDPTIKGNYASVGYAVAGCADWSLLDPKKDPAERLSAAKQRLLSTGIRATGEKELTITLREPAAYFSSVLALWIFAPVRESDVSHGGELWTEPATYIGNGPFVLRSWKHDERMVYVPNPHYRAPPRVKQWTKLFISNPAIALNAYRHSEIDVMSAGVGGGGAAALLANVETEPALKADLHTGPNGCVSYATFNARRPPFDDAVARLAFAKALDRNAYIKDVLGGSGAPALSLIPAGLPGYDPGDTAQRFDPGVAKTLLGASKYAGSLALASITVPYDQQSLLAKQDAEWLRAQWSANLGVTVVTEPLDSVELSQRKSKAGEDFPQVIPRSTWCSDYPDQQDWLTLLFHSRSQLALKRGWTDAEFDRLVTEADRERDKTRRDGLYVAASRLLSTSAPAAFLFAGRFAELRKPWVRGVIDGPFGSAFDGLGAGSIFVAKRRS